MKTIAVVVAALMAMTACGLVTRTPQIVIELPTATAPPEPTAEPTPTPQPSPAPTPTAEPTPTATPSPAPTPTAEPTPTATPAITATAAPVEATPEPAATPETEEYVVPVYFCTASPLLGPSHLEATVEWLDRRIGPFFDRESSGRADVRIVAGGIVSPDGIDWQSDTLDTLFAHTQKEFVHNGRLMRGTDPCVGAVIAHIGDWELPRALVLADVPTGSNVSGYGIRAGTAVTSLRALTGDETGRAVRTIAHELAHSLFALDHTTRACAWSLMTPAVDDPCQKYPSPLVDSRILCSQRQLLDWPCD